MNIIMALLIGLAVNLDNLLIGIQLGARHQQLRIWQNLIISGTTGLCAFASAYAACLISENFLVYTNLIGSAIMIGFGIFCLYQSVISEDETPAVALSPGFRDILILAVVLSVNCIPPCFSAGVMKLSPWLTGFFSMLFSFFSLQISFALGHRLLQHRFFPALTPLSAILLILIGTAGLML